MADTIYWEHGPDCWQRSGVDMWGDMAITPEDENPYCAWDLAKRLADDPTAVPSECGGRWVRLVPVEMEDGE